jgi:hypothetical protein
MSFPDEVEDLELFQKELELMGYRSTVDVVREGEKAFLVWEGAARPNNRIGFYWPEGDKWVLDREQLPGGAKH